MSRLYLLLQFSLILLFTSCATQNQSPSQNEQILEESNDGVAIEGNESQTQKENNYSVGKVVLSQEGCALSLILEGKDEICYYPVNLEDKFRVDGAILKFQKFLSRAPLPNGCESCRTIQVQEVERLKP